MLLSEKKYDGILEKINCWTTTQKAAKVNLYNVLVTDKEILNIESLYPDKDKLKFIEISNIRTKMLYYYYRNNIDKAKENAKKIIDLSCDLKFYNDEAKRIDSLFFIKINIIKNNSCKVIKNYVSWWVWSVHNLSLKFDILLFKSFLFF